MKHLIWKCRRGTLELDTLLSRFVKIEYSTLSEDEKKQFEVMLEWPDPVLWEWLSGAVKAEAAYQGIVDKIRGQGK